MDLIKQILTQLNITNPDFIRIISEALLRAATKAKKKERKRCYEFAMYCRNNFLQYKEDLPQDIVVATEVVAEGIQKGSRVRKNARK